MPDLTLKFRKLNERQVNPNPNIVFISVLKSKKNADQAESMMRALAAQMKPIMDKKNLIVQHFEEARWNSVWAGRNANHGMRIELVLRSKSGAFLPMKWLVDVLCHELSHNQHMNHGADFQSLMAELKNEVRMLQQRGYFGDGFYSAGRRLIDGSPDNATSIIAKDMPQYVCDGHFSTKGDAKKGRSGLKTRPKGMVNGVASHMSGSQTAKKRKAGGKMNWEADGGNTLGGPATTPGEIDSIKRRYTEERKRLKSAGEPMSGACRIFSPREWEIYISTTRGRSVKAKSARDLRAEAIEKRLGLGKKDVQTTLDKSLQSTTRKNGKKKIEVASSSDIESEVESEDGYPSVLPVENEGQEIDELASSDSEGSGSPVPEIPEAERDLLRIDIADLTNDMPVYDEDLTEESDDEDEDNQASVPPQQSSSSTGKNELNSRMEPESKASTRTFFEFESKLAQAYKDLEKAKEDKVDDGDEAPTPNKRAKTAGVGKKANSGGMSGRGQRLGEPSKAVMGPTRISHDSSLPLNASLETPRPKSKAKASVYSQAEVKPSSVHRTAPAHLPWNCPACTFKNIADAGVCDVCSTRPNGTRPEDVIVIEID